QVRVAEPPGAEPDDIQVERPRTPALLAHPAVLVLDAVQLLEEAAGVEGGLHQHHLVEVPPLPLRPDRVGLLDAADREDDGERQLADRFAGGGEPLFALPQVAAEGDIRTFTRVHSSWEKCWAIASSRSATPASSRMARSSSA